jgi:hypothetical protein
VFESRRGFPGLADADFWPAAQSLYSRLAQRVVFEPPRLCAGWQDLNVQPMFVKILVSGSGSLEPADFLVI